MTIGIVSPFNPNELKDLLYKEDREIVHNNGVTASSVHALVRGYLKIGCCVKIFTYDNVIEKETEYHGEKLDIFVIPQRLFGKIRKGMGLLGRLFMPFHLKKIICRNASDITVLHAQWTYDYAVACIPFSDKIPTFCTVRDWCPYLITLAKGWKEKLYWIISYYEYKKVMNSKHIHLIANSHYTSERLKSIYIQKSPILFNPINSKYYLNSRTKYPEHPIFISIAQDLDDKRKNIVGLLKAFREYRKEDANSELWLVGMYSDDLCNFIYETIPNVRLWGRLELSEIIELLDHSSVLVHPSFEETFGNIILEAMSRRVPVIGGMNSGAIPLLLEGGKYGCLCNVYNPYSIYQAMKKVTTQSEYRETIIERSSQYLFDNFLDYNVAQKHIEYFGNFIK